MTQPTRWKIARRLARAGAMLAGLAVFAGGFDAVANEAALPVDRVVAAHYPPLMIEGNDEAPGFAVEVVQTAARHAGRTVSVEFLPFQRAMYQVRNRPDTLMPALFRSVARESTFQWVAQVHSAKLRFVTLDDPISKLEDARDLNVIAAESGTSSEGFLITQGFENIVATIDPDSSAEMLAHGRVDAWFLTENLATQVWREHSLDQKLFFSPVMHELTFIW